MDFSKSLQELEDKDWSDPEDAPTPMVARCWEAMRVPLDQMSAEQCRLLLGQKIGVPFLVPLALRFLADNPMEGGDMVPGTLLRFVLELPAEFWRSDPDLWWEIKEIFFLIEVLREEIEVLTPKMRRCEALDVN